MADIVERLRNEHKESDMNTVILCLDAANEIERLREVIDILLKHQAREAFDTKPSDSPTD